ncbi:hypothetical protein PLICRDRAFT_34413 [Plicaturopsis crispa FD-325 SS-3]|nr:hypothetical protein PLICRDRAFT_34413 [Plicaturopsis crispa FD-325 SS-3]
MPSYISPTPPEPSLPEPCKNAKYFMQDVNVTFLVEHKSLFQVYSYFFRTHSQWFRDLFDVHRVFDVNTAYSEPPTIPLTDVAVVDFERFLSVLFPTEFGVYDATTVEEWTSILDLAVRWGFSSIRTLAIKQLTDLASPVDKIVLGRKYEITAWLAGAYDAILRRAAALSEEEGVRLGMREAMKIAKAREDMRVRFKFVDAPTAAMIVKRTVGLESKEGAGVDFSLGSGAAAGNLKKAFSVEREDYNRAKTDEIPGAAGDSVSYLDSWGTVPADEIPGAAGDSVSYLDSWGTVPADEIPGAAEDSVSYLDSWGR